MKGKFFWMQAFEAHPFSGNPCPVYLLPKPLEEVRMLAIAKEMNQSETAFVHREKGRIHARYFTCLEEIPMAGHPTLCTAKALVEAGWVEAGSRIGLHLPAGVYFCGADQNEAYMEQEPIASGNRLSKESAAELGGLNADDFFAPPQIFSTGTPMLMVPLKPGRLAGIHLNREVLTRLKAEMDFFSVHFFEWDEENRITQARHLGHDGEDSFTGSATGAMAAWLAAHGYVKDRFTALQGEFVGREGRADVKILSDSIRIQGRVRTLVSGEFNLDGLSGESEASRRSFQP